MGLLDVGLANGRVRQRAGNRETGWLGEGNKKINKFLLLKPFLFFFPVARLFGCRKDNMLWGIEGWRWENWEKMEREGS